MAALPPADRHGGSDALGTQALICSGCGSTDDLIIEFIGPIKPKIAGRISVEYSCSACGSFSAQDATVQQVAEILNSGATAPGVLHFGRYFIHCGEPMLEIAEGLSHLHVPAGSQGNPAGPISVRTHRLKCHCGFQLDVPL
ncbi:hypothetical protein [Arthrobacter dokdonensis]|uniref:hypothetical protein n=1 Tax=Arthrobacter dokdonellae TaxID=2211210 RepID=UPI000DE5A4B2|nr:hypothetical protein [Arthrobacter dokdonellae]